MVYRHILLLILPFIISACSSSSTPPPANTTTSSTTDPCGSASGATGTVVAATSWFSTSPDVVDLSMYKCVRIQVTFTNDGANVMTFNSSPQFQLWSEPSTYDFVAADVTINAEPSGTVDAAATYSYDLTIDLANMPAGDVRLSIRPVDNNFYGTIGPTSSSVSDSVVTLMQ